MPTYQVDVGNKTYEVDAPDSNTAWQWANFTHSKAAKEPVASKERTIGEAFTDIGAAGLSGIGSLVQLPGQLYGLATGDFSKTGALGAGQELEEYAKGLKSKGLLAREAARDVAMQNAEKQGQLQAFKTAIGQTISDPALLSTFLAEQLPQLVPAALTGGATAAAASGNVLAKAAARQISKEAAEKVAQREAIRAGTSAAIGTGAVQQGADIGAGTYDEVVKELVDKGATPEQAGKAAINLARASGVSGAALSLIANRYLPGGQALERVLAGGTTGKGLLMGAATGALKELPSEVLEETGGKFTQNLALREVKPEQSLTQGLGATAGQAALGAVGLGGVTGAVGGRGAAPATTTEEQQTPAITPAPTAAPEAEKERSIEELLAAGKKPPVEFKAPKDVTITAPKGSLDELEQIIAAQQQKYDTRKQEIERKQGMNQNPKNQIQKNEQLAAELTAMREALAKRIEAGETYVTKSDQGTGGAGPEVSVPAGTTVPPAGGTETSQRGGVDSTGQNAGAVDTGTAGQQASVTPPAETQVTPPTGANVGTQTTQTQQAEAQGQKPPAAPAVKTAVDEDEDLINKLFGDDGLPSTGSARRTKAQIADDEKREALGKRYGLVQRDGESQQDFGQRIREAHAFEKERQGKPLSAMSTQAIAGQELKEEKGYFPPQEQRDLYEETRQEYNERVDEQIKTGEATEDDKLPAYKELSDDDRRVYFQNNIQQNNQVEHDKAAKALAEHLSDKRSESRAAPDYQRTEATDQIRAQKSYERERGGFGSKTGMAYTFPGWNSLSDESRRIFSSINKTDTVLEQDMAFRAVKKQVQKEKLEEQSRERLQEAESRAKQEMLAAAERARKKQAAGKGQILPDAIIEKLARGDIKGVLEYIKEQGHGLKLKRGYTLVPQVDKNGNVVNRRRVANIRDSVAQRLFQTLASRLISIEGLEVKVVFDENLTQAQIAKYDANTNTLYVGPNGLDEATILHELTHAATVKIIHQFFTDKTKLSPHMVKAVEQIQKIAAAARNKTDPITNKRLDDAYANAFENLYEFVAYAMTDMDFQYALSTIQVESLADVTNKTAEQSKDLQYERELGRLGYDNMVETLWDAFTGSIAYMYSLFRPAAEFATTYLFSESSRAVTTKGPGAAEKLLTEEEKKNASFEITVPKGKGEKTETYRITNLLKDVLKEPGYRGNLLLETAAAFNEILAAPEGGIERLAGREAIGAELESKGSAAGKPTTQKAPKATTQRSPDEIIAEQKLPEDKSAHKVRDFMTSTAGARRLATIFANSRYPIKVWEDALQRAKKTIDAGPKLNNIYTQITLSAARAKDLYLTMVNKPAADLQKAIGEYAEAAKVDSGLALKQLHTYFMALHEPERRAVKFLRNVPLKNANVQFNGRTINPANFRQDVLEAVESGKLTKKEVQRLRKELDDVVAQFAEASGSSPGGYKTIDVNGSDYNVIGNLSPAEAQAIRNKFDGNKQAKAVITAMEAMNNVTAELNKKANYWSKPVQSVVDFYGWKHYIPFKGKEISGAQDGMLDFDILRTDKRFAEKLQDFQSEFEGRESWSDNSLTQIMSDATRAAMRAGRKDLTLAIKNAIEQKLLMGSVNEVKGLNGNPVEFADRNKIDLGELSGKTTIFHYNENGSIDVLQVYSEAERNAIRRAYQQTNPLIDMLNQVTSTVGQFHTRYNVAFAPMNYFRDMLTNAFTIGTDMNATTAAQYIGAVTSQVVNGGMYKTWKIASLYNSGKMAELNAFVAKDKSGFSKDVMEYIKEGGMVSYLQGLSAKGTFQNLQKDLNSSKPKKALEAMNGFFDVYADMFELSSRTAAYRITRNRMMQEDKLSEEAAKTRAAAYVKNLANFEQTGEWGRGAGAMFMFFRPAATGAVRAIETLGPMIRSTDEAVMDLPPEVRKDAKAVAEFRKSHEKQRKAAQAMTMSLAGFGVAMYLLSMALSDDDDMGRNRTKTDDINRWTRYARFHIPGIETPIQIPWGFGLGSFAAAGAQVAAMGNGQASLKEGFSNVLSVMMDSFLPLPVSRINMFDNFPAWLMDSTLPSVARPLFEWQMNMDALGREIYNNRQTRVGDAYTGGDNIPELYKYAARTIADVTNGAVDWSPNTMYFFANNYGDGLMRIAQTGMNLSLLATGEKAFNPKTDTVLFDSFFGSASNYDAKQFSSIENQIKDMERKLKMFESNPEQYQKYVEANPMDEYLVKMYNEGVNGRLKEYREEANKIRKMPDLSPKDRTDALKNIVQMQNFEKRHMIDAFEMFDIKP